MIEATISSLPEHLLERTRIARDSDTAGGLVLYWMRSAIRADENPALDVARLVAHQYDLPLLVYHGLSEHYDYASDRHHWFMIEGARDVQNQMRELGVSYAFHLATRADRRPHLVELARQAAVLVTEDMPTGPPRHFLNQVLERTRTPVLCVDTACIVPMLLQQEPYTRAFEYRNATKDLYRKRLNEFWPSVDIAVRSFDLEALPFQRIDFDDQSVAELVARCEIDHSVARVVDTVGGSQAGSARWNRFREERLSSYARNRNDALENGVSRLSPYLHYGMISPMRIAREAANVGGAGSEKFLDELLIWRELAYGFCFYREDHDQWSAIPKWAQQTLSAHARDQRANVYSWEELVRGKTHDPLWNAAQQSLLRQGEVHNNVRMTWGKAILNWTTSPQAALKMIVDLNNRYALDGRDPASYGGILWCLGQFDRPFNPEQPIIGSVRPRPTAIHSQRLDTERYLDQISTPRFQPIPKVAVVGAGISGLIAARTLADHGLPVTVFDKGRGVGGRMSTRRVEGDPCFDHGAQYFTARDPGFQRFVHSWQDQGIVQRWPDAELDPSQRIVVLKQGEVSEKPDACPRFVGTPGMNAICQHLAREVDVRVSTRVAEIEPVESANRLTDQSGNVLGDFEHVVVSAPALQSATLLSNFPTLAEPISQIGMQPCWAVMASFESPITNDWVGAFIHDSMLSWAARNSTKPSRPTNADHLVLHAGHEWSKDNWNRDPDQIAKILLEEFWQAAGLQRREPIRIQAHGWKFAIPLRPADQRCFFDPASGIVACGDWAGGPRVEGAFLSGLAAAGRILGSLTSPSENSTSQLKLF